jgi:hypothetical protein
MLIESLSEGLFQVIFNMMSSGEVLKHRLDDHALPLISAIISDSHFTELSDDLKSEIVEIHKELRKLKRYDMDKISIEVHSNLHFRSQGMMARLLQLLCETSS